MLINRLKVITMQKYIHSLIDTQYLQALQRFLLEKRSKSMPKKIRKAVLARQVGRAAQTSDLHCHPSL
jgi:hypothetical protein